MFQNIPLAVVLSWPAPIPDPPNKVSTVLATEITLSVILTLVVGLRFVSRIWITRRIHVDDWLIIPGYIFTMTFNLVTMISTRYGWGYHIWDVPITHWVPLLKLTYTYTPIFVGANSFTKLSILFFYRRLFASDAKFLKVVNISIIVVILWNIAFGLLGIFVCTPLKAYWVLEPIPGQRCYDVVGFEAYGGTDVAVDLYLMLLFQWKIWKMELPLSKKISVAFIMSFAGLAVAATVMRIPYILKACLHVDKSWDGMELTLWSSGELVLGILCASAPALRAFFTRKNRHILTGKLHSMNYWHSHDAAGAARNLETCTDIETGQSTLKTCVTDTSAGKSEMNSKEKPQHVRVGSVASAMSKVLGKDRNSSAVVTKDATLPISGKSTEESPLAKNPSIEHSDHSQISRGNTNVRPASFGS